MILQPPLSPQAAVCPEIDLSAQGEVMLRCWPTGWSSPAPLVDISQWRSVGSRQALPLCLCLERPKDPGLKTQQIKGPAGLNRGCGKGGQGAEDSGGGGSWFQKDTCRISAPVTSLSHLLPAVESYEENINNTQRSWDSQQVKWFTWSYRPDWWQSRDSNPHPSDAGPVLFPQTSRDHLLLLGSQEWETSLVLGGWGEKGKGGFGVCALAADQRWPSALCPSDSAYSANPARAEGRPSYRVALLRSHSNTPEVTNWQPAGQNWPKAVFCLALKSWNTQYILKTTSVANT